MPRQGLDQRLVLQAAIELADEQGLETVTLAALAKKLSIRTPSLYNHVDGLQGLRGRLSQLSLQRLYERLARAAVGMSKDEAIRAMAQAYIVFAREHPGLYEATQRPAYWQGNEAKEKAEQIVQLFVQVFHGYGLDEVLSIHFIRGLRSLLHGFASLEQQGGFGMPVGVNESLAVLIDTYLAGIPAFMATRADI